MAHAIFTHNGKKLADITITSITINPRLQLEALAELLHIDPNNIQTTIVWR